MAQTSWAVNSGNPWGGRTAPAPTLAPRPTGSTTNPVTPTANIPNASAIGNTEGTGEPLMPQVPDLLGQAGAKFNDFQPMNLPGVDLGNMFSGFDQFQQQMGQGPQIPVNDVISGQQQNQLLNSAIGANAAQRQTGERDAMNNLGGRGFTNESPALQATRNRLGLNEALANTQARVDIPMQANRQNADYRLAATQANLGQRNADYQNFLGSENAKTNRISPLLSALVGLA